MPFYPEWDQVLSAVLDTVTSSFSQYINTSRIVTAGRVWAMPCVMPFCHLRPDVLFKQHCYGFQSISQSATTLSERVLYDSGLDLRLSYMYEL